MAVQPHEVHRAVPRGADDLAFGSGYGGNALLGKKCYALRIAAAMARDEGWLAEHMLILKLTAREGRSTTSRPRSPVPAARPTSRCSQPTIPGWKVETLGDDIAWMRIGEDGRLYAVNPEFGFFGVAPGTNEHTNPNAMRTIAKGNSIFTNVALTDDGDIWWEGLENKPDHATSWKASSVTFSRSPTSEKDGAAAPTGMPGFGAAVLWPPRLSR